MSAAENYRKIRNTLRWMLGALGSSRGSARSSCRTTNCLSSKSSCCTRSPTTSPEIEARLCRGTTTARVISVLALHSSTRDLSAFYFDIRKDTLYCEAPSSVKAERGAHRDRPAVAPHHALAGADPPLFTAEEAWLGAVAGRQVPVHSRLFTACVGPHWCDDKARREAWETTARSCRVVSGSPGARARRASALVPRSKPRLEIYVSEKA